MTVTLFLALIVILAVCVSLITEAVKKALEGVGQKYPANVVVLAVAVVVGAGGTAIAYTFMGIPFTPPNILCMGLMALAVWVGAMVGYDKVIQLVEQIKGIQK